jgi:hypothetical protein
MGGKQALEERQRVNQFLNTYTKRRKKKTFSSISTAAGLVGDKIKNI